MKAFRAHSEQGAESEAGRPDRFRTEKRYNGMQERTKRKNTEWLFFVFSDHNRKKLLAYYWLQR